MRTFLFYFLFLTEALSCGFFQSLFLDCSKIPQKSKEVCFEGICLNRAELEGASKQQEALMMSDWAAVLSEYLVIAELGKKNLMQQSADTFLEAPAVMSRFPKKRNEIMLKYQQSFLRGQAIFRFLESKAKTPGPHYWGEWHIFDFKNEKWLITEKDFEKYYEEFCRWTGKSKPSHCSWLSWIGRPLVLINRIEIQIGKEQKERLYQLAFNLFLDHYFEKLNKQLSSFSCPARKRMSSELQLGVLGRGENPFRYLTPEEFQFVFDNSQCGA